MAKKSATVKRKSRAKPATPAKPVKPSKARQTIVKPQRLWIETCIPTPERKCLIEEIKYWLGRCPTNMLIEVLPLVSKRVDDSHAKTHPVKEIEVNPAWDRLAAPATLSPEERKGPPGGPFVIGDGPLARFLDDGLYSFSQKQKASQRGTPAAPAQD